MVYSNTLKSKFAVIDIIRSQVKERTKQFDFFIVKKFDTFVRTPDEERAALEITGIQWVNSSVVQDNQLYIEELSCDTCKVNYVCEDCLSKPGASTNKDIVGGTEGASEGSDDVSDLHDNEDDEQLDVDNSEKSKDKNKVEDRECVSAGDIAWAKYGRIWYPPQVCTQNEIPEHVLQKITKHTQRKVFGKRWGRTTFQMLNYWHETKLMKIEQHDPLKRQKCITLPYLKTLISEDIDI